jgi:hypothetical protein
MTIRSANLRNKIVSVAPFHVLLMCFGTYTPVCFGTSTATLTYITVPASQICCLVGGKDVSFRRLSLSVRRTYITGSLV